MGSIAVITTFSPLGYQVYGKRMLETFDQYWPLDVDLFVYYEGVKPTSPPGRGEWLPLDADLDRKRFMARHRDHPIDYRQMPVKFSHKVWAITNAAKDADFLLKLDTDEYASTYDWLIWLDGDIETRAPVTHEFLNSILPDDVIAAYLGRRWWKHTESGFLAYRMSEMGRTFLADMRKFYIDDEVMKCSEKHDCMVFDGLRQLYENAGGHKFYDIGGNFQGPSIDVMAHSPLGAVLWHNKGAARKQRAYGAVA